jgi:hypothetical protein
MSSKHRVIGTTEQALARTEAQLPHPLPRSFRAWLKQNNGLGLDSVTIFPVLDDRDPRKTWDSIVRQYEQWKSYAEEIIEVPADDLAPLLPFGSYGTGDYYCFCYASADRLSEPTVVRWSHENGETEPRGGSFPEFMERLAEGEFEDD